MITKIMNDADIIKCMSFAKEMVQNNNNKSFHDSRAISRSDSIVFDNILNGKLSEVFVSNLLFEKGIKNFLDFNIYNHKKGDNGKDILINADLFIDIKSSTLKAKYLLVDAGTLKYWKSIREAPPYLCMIGVGKTGNNWTVKYKGGINTIEFLDKGEMKKRGEKLPNTSCILEADNYALNLDLCYDFNNLIDFINRKLK